MSNLYTESDVRALPKGSQLVLEPGDLVTPAGLDEANLRRIHVVRGGAPRAAAASDPVWQQMLARDGSYVVQVTKGRARVFRMTPDGPQPVGEGGA